MITLLIPTLNRSEFIKRYLYYLKNTGFKGVVCIGDSSNTYHFSNTAETIDFLQNFFKLDFKIIHKELPGLKPAECIRELLPLIETPYCLCIPDDDLIVPKTLDKAVDFLRANPDYSATGGIVLHCHIKGNDIKDITEGNFNALEENSAYQRLNALYKHYTVILYSLSRTEQFKKRYPLDNKFSDIEFNAELLPCGMLAIQGKVKKLDDIFVVRQLHKQRYIIDKQSQGNDWLYSYDVFIRVLADELAKAQNQGIPEMSTQAQALFDSINHRLAQDTVKKAFGYYLQSVYSSNNEKKSRLKTLLANIPGLKLSYLAIRNWQRNRKTEICLPKLLKPESRYYGDFLPAYKAIIDD